MNKDRTIEKFISRSIKNGDNQINETELQSLFDQMTIDEISLFWSHYYSFRSLHEASVKVPDWRTREQEKYFLNNLSSYQYYPKEKDSNGKYIIDRDDFINHIKAHIINRINNSIKSNIEFNHKPFLEKLPYYLMIYALLTIPLAIAFYFLGSLIFNKQFVEFLTITIISSYGFTGLVIYPIVISIIKRKHKKNRG